MKDFCNHEQSLALKELGFDDPGIAWFTEKKEHVIAPESYRKWTQKILNNTNIAEILNNQCVVSPIYSQVFRWFREKYNLRHTITDFIDDETGIEWDYEIAVIGTDVDENGNYKPLVDYSTDDKTRKFKTFEEAESACLDKLIEIVKERLNNKQQ